MEYFVKIICYCILQYVFIKVNHAAMRLHERYEDCKNLYSVFHLDRNVHVADCKPVSLTTFQSNDSKIWKLRINAVADHIFLNLHKTDSLLADLDTPVWIGVNNSSNVNATTYRLSSIRDIAPELLKISIYQDFQTKSAIIVFIQEHTGSIMEGFVENYILRCRPDTNDIYKRKYVLFKLGTRKIRKYKYSSYADPNLYNLNAIHLNTIGIKLLIALDWNPNIPRLEQLKTLLMYYNAIDMLYSNFTYPKIQFTIKGIVIPENEYACPYLKSKKANPNYINLLEAGDNILSYFTSKNAEIFNFTKYDIVIGMSSLPFCWVENICPTNVIVTESTRICSKNDEEASEFPTVIGIRHPNFQGGYSLTAQILAFLFDADYNLPYAESYCHDIMNRLFYKYDTELPLSWSLCTLQRLSNYFRTADCSYFTNSIHQLSFENSLDTSITQMPTETEHINDTTYNVTQNWWKTFMNKYLFKFN